MLYHIVWGLDGFGLTQSSLTRANLLRSCGGSNYEGHRTGYFKFACLEIALQRERMGVMKVTSTGRRSKSTYGGVSSVLVCPYGRLIAHGPSQRVSPWGRHYRKSGSCFEAGYGTKEGFELSFTRKIKQKHPWRFLRMTEKYSAFMPKYSSQICLNATLVHTNTLTKSCDKMSKYALLKTINASAFCINHTKNRSLTPALTSQAVLASLMMRCCLFSHYLKGTCVCVH